MNLILVPFNEEVRNVVEAADTKKDKTIEESEKQLSEDVKKLLDPLKAVFSPQEKYNSEKKAGLHDSIVSITKEYKGLEPMDVYLWIADGAVDKAEEYFREGERASKELKKTHYPYGDKFNYEGTALQLETAPDGVSRPTMKPDVFYQEIFAISPEKIRMRPLKLFLETLGKIEDASIQKKMGNILHERMEELRHFGAEQADTILKVTISSLKALGNQNPTVPELQFDEQFLKETIIKGYRKEQVKKTPEEREILSTCQGRITGVTFFLTVEHSKEYLMAEDFYTPILAIFNGKKDDPSFKLKLVYTNENECENIKRFFIAHGVDPLEFETKTVFVKAGDIDTQANYDIWSRDGAVRRRDGTIVEPYDWYADGSGSAYDSLVPIEATDIEQSELLFEGGNMRSTDTHLFIGSDTIYKTIQKMKGRWPGYPHGTEQVTAEEFAKFTDFENTTSEDIARAVALFEKEFGKKVIVVGLGKNPDGTYQTTDQLQRYFHIDMVITPLEGNDIMVAEVPGDFVLESIAHQLETEGFHVLRVPMINKEWYPPGSRESKEYYITYNNALVETYTDDGKQLKRVYLPQYYDGTEEAPIYSHEGIDLQRLNDDARVCFEEQGYTVIPVPVSVGIIKQRGSLNCITFEDRE